MIWLSASILLGLMTYLDWNNPNPQIIIRCLVCLIAMGVLLFHFVFWFPPLEQTPVETTKTNIRSLEQALDLYRLNNHSYPTTEQGLGALRTQPTIEPVPDTWKGPYVRGALPMDGWGNAIQYASDGIDYEIWSFGEDGEIGGEGDDADIYASKP